MAKQAAEKAKKEKAKPAPAGAEKPKKAKAKPVDTPEAAAQTEKAASQEKAKPAPRPPADPRLKYLKKFYGKFLPRGPLRDRHKALMQRWNSGDDHGGVTVQELKSLHDDWKSARQKPARAGATSG
jgi:hypothetical protein